MKLSKLQRTKARATIAAHYEVDISRVLWTHENCFIVMLMDGKTRVIHYDPTTESILSEKAF
jgi:hypothetical protein